MAFPCRHNRDDDTNVDVHSAVGTPLRYVSLDHVYSATSPCVSASGSSNVMSKKVKARKLTTMMMMGNRNCDDDDHHHNHQDGDEEDGGDEHQKTTSVVTESFSDNKPQPPLIHVYSRREKKNKKKKMKNLLRHSGEAATTTAFYDSLMARAEPKSEVLVGGEDCGVEGSEVGGRLLKMKKKNSKKRGDLGIGELVKLGVDESVLSSLDRPRLRDCRSYAASNGVGLKRKRRNPSKNCDRVLSDSPAAKRWVR